jgi:hypothetical protein
LRFFLKLGVFKKFPLKVILIKIVYGILFYFNLFREGGILDKIRIRRRGLEYVIGGFLLISVIIDDLIVDCGLLEI